MSNQQIIKSIIDGRDLEPGELEYDWQEFVLKRMDAIDEEAFEEIDALLEQVSDNELANSIRESIIKGEYKKYNRGFLDCFKLAITLERLWRGDTLRY